MKTKYLRHKHKKSIKNLETGEIENFESFNKAKKKSRTLQIANGGLGKGSLKLAEAFDATV